MEQHEIRGPNGLRIGRVDNGVFFPFGRYHQNPCPEFLKGLGFTEEDGRFIWRVDAESKKDTPARVRKPRRGKGSSDTENPVVGGDGEDPGEA